MRARDLALMSDDMGKLPWLIRHSRRTMAVIRQNIAFSLAVKLVVVTLTFAGYSLLWAVIAADTGASLLVIFNGLRLLKAGWCPGRKERSDSSQTTDLRCGIHHG